MHALIGHPAHVPRQGAPRSLVQIVSGHATIDLHRSNERLCEFDLRHPGQRAATAMVPTHQGADAGLAGRSVTTTGMAIA